MASLLLLRVMLPGVVLFALGISHVNALAVALGIIVLGGLVTFGLTLRAR